MIISVLRFSKPPIIILYLTNNRIIIIRREIHKEVFVFYKGSFFLMMMCFCFYVSMYVYFETVLITIF